jgi:hypothetical protein
VIDVDVRRVRVVCDVCRETYLELELPRDSGGWSTDHAVRRLGWTVSAPGWHACLRCASERVPGGVVPAEAISRSLSGGMSGS